MVFHTEAEGVWINWKVLEMIVWNVAEPCIEICLFYFFFQAEDGIRDVAVTGVQTCALPIYHLHHHQQKYQITKIPNHKNTNQQKYKTAGARKRDRKSVV